MIFLIGISSWCIAFNKKRQKHLFLEGINLNFAAFKLLFIMKGGSRACLDFNSE